MLPLLAPLLLLVGATPPQEIVRDTSTLRELRIHALGSLAEDKDKPGRARDWAERAGRYCLPALDPREERIQADEQGYLIAYLQPAQHAWLQNFLSLQHGAARAWLAQVDAQLYSVPKGELMTLKLEGSATLLPDAAAIQRMQDALAARNGELLNSPRLTLLPNQLGNLSALSETAYIRTYELQVIEPGHVEIADPIVDVIKEGLTMDLRVLQVDAELYGLEIASQVSELERPIPTKKLVLSPLHPMEVEIGLPQVRTAQVSATVRLADGAGVLLIAGGLLDDCDLALIVTFHRALAPPPQEERLEETIETR